MGGRCIEAALACCTHLIEEGESLERVEGVPVDQNVSSSFDRWEGLQKVLGGKDGISSLCILCPNKTWRRIQSSLVYIPSYGQGSRQGQGQGQGQEQEPWFDFEFESPRV